MFRAILVSRGSLERGIGWGSNEETETSVVYFITKMCHWIPEISPMGLHHVEDIIGLTSDFDAETCLTGRTGFLTIYSVRWSKARFVLNVGSATRRGVQPYKKR